MNEVSALSKAFALEGAFHFVELTLEAVRRNGADLLRPEILPFRSMPLCEAVASSAAGIALVFDVPVAWDVFDVAMAVHVAAYLWVETGIHAVAIAFLLFLVPELTKFALPASLLVVILLMLQPRRVLPPSLWQHALFLSLLSSSRLLAFAGHPVPATICLGVSVEVAAEAFSQRMYGPVLRSPEGASYGVRAGMWLLFGVRLVDARAWLRWRPAMPSGLPEGVRGVRFFCGSRIVRGVRFHTGRVVSRDTVAVSIGEWDEIAFAPNPLGFCLALLSSLRLPMSLRARMSEGRDSLLDTRLVLLFFELPSSWWTSLTEGYEQTGGACMVEGATLLLPSRQTLRRITEALLSWMLLEGGA